MPLLGNLRTHLPCSCSDREGHMLVPALPWVSSWEASTFPPRTCHMYKRLLQGEANLHIPLKGEWHGWVLGAPRFPAFPLRCFKKEPLTHYKEFRKREMVRRGWSQTGGFSFIQQFCYRLLSSCFSCLRRSVECLRGGSLSLSWSTGK